MEMRTRAIWIASPVPLKKEVPNVRTAWQANARGMVAAKQRMSVPRNFPLSRFFAGESMRKYRVVKFRMAQIDVERARPLCPKSKRNMKM